MLKWVVVMSMPYQRIRGLMLRECGISSIFMSLIGETEIFSGTK